MRMEPDEFLQTRCPAGADIPVLPPWTLRHSHPVPQPASLAFLVTGDADSFLWIAAPTNITDHKTTISHPASNDDTSLILLATHNWNPAGGSGTFNLNNTTRVSHALLDGNPSATFQVTSYWGGNANDHQVGVYYDGASWRVFNQDSASMSAAVGFNISID